MMLLGYKIHKNPSRKLSECNSVEPDQKTLQVESLSLPESAGKGQSFTAGAPGFGSQVQYLLKG